MDMIEYVSRLKVLPIVISIFSGPLVSIRVYICDSVPRYDFVM